MLQLHIYKKPSKNRTGGLAQMRVKNKVIKIENVSAAGTRCHVYVLDEYFSKLPQEAFERDNFYVQLLPNCDKGSTDPWFSAKPVGKNVLGKMVKRDE